MNINWINLLRLGAIFLMYIISSCSGLYLIKVAQDWKTLVFVFGLILYGIGALIWMVILRLMPLSLSFPIAAGLLIIGTMITGIFFLNETISASQIVGAIMIIFGITLIAINH